MKFTRANSVLYDNDTALSFDPYPPLELLN